MRRVSMTLLGVTILLGVLVPAASGQDLRPLGTDISTLLNGIGESILPNMQQNVLADNGIGAASMGSSRFLIGLEGGVTFGSPGLLAVLKQSPTPFQLIDVNGLINNLGSDPTLTKYLNRIEDLSYFPYPESKLVVGVKPAFGIEIVGTFFILPQQLTDFVLGLAGQKNSGIQFNTLGATVHVRKVLMEDQGGFPAISVGVGYAYSSLHAAYALPQQTQQFAGYQLTYSGTLDLTGTLNTVGADLSISKRLLIFTPFIRIAPWYQWASFSGGMKNFSFNLAGATNVIDPAAPNAEITDNNLSFLISGGVEINLGAFSLVPGGSFDLANKNFSANLSSRVQF